jgi:16S rRNA processing protein RimM
VRGLLRKQPTDPSPALAPLGHPLPQGERVTEQAAGPSIERNQPNRVLVAHIGAPQGLRGEVRLWTFGTDPMALKSYGPLQAAEGRSFEIENLRPGKGFLVAQFAGVTGRTAAEALRNLDLYVPRERLSPPEEGEFYHADLIGLSAVTQEGRAFGTVVAVQNFGAGDLIEIRPEAGPTIMLPFTAEAVPVVDLAGRRLVIDPPSGLLPSSLVGEGGEASAAKPSRVRGRFAVSDVQQEPLTRSSPPAAARPTLSHKGRG